VRSGDVARLTAIPGVGKKTAERIGLELKDKMGALSPLEGATTTEGSDAEALRVDVLSALVNLGYHRPLAEKAVESAIKSTPGGDFERTLKQSLRDLAR